MIDQQLLEAADELRTAATALEPPSEHPRSGIGPLVAVTALIVVLLAIGSAGLLFPRRGSLPVAPASPSSAPSSVSTAAFVSELGNLTLVSGDGSVTSVDVDAGIPILGDATIPNPRWLFDDRLVEYVADDAGTV